MFRTEPRSALPVKLAKEPLVDAVFEMRFESLVPAASLLPGLLYGSLPWNMSIEALPQGAIPKEIRDSDPSFAFVPIVRLRSEDYWLMIGDNVFAVAARLPYKGWSSFKEAILASFDIVLKTQFITAVSRCSIKYVDILDGVPLDPDQCFSLNLSLGGRTTESNDFHVRLGFIESGITHMLQVASKVSVSVDDGKPLNGPVLDVDSVMEFPNESPSEFLGRLSLRAQQLHDANKELVFDCLSDKALKYLEPAYE